MHVAISLVLNFNYLRHAMIQFPKMCACKTQAVSVGMTYSPHEK